MVKNWSLKKLLFLAIFVVLATFFANYWPSGVHFGVPGGLFLRFFWKSKKWLIPVRVITFWGSGPPKIDPHRRQKWEKTASHKKRAEKISLERHFAKKLNFWSILGPQGGPKRGSWKKQFVNFFDTFWWKSALRPIFTIFPSSCTDSGQIWTIFDQKLQENWFLRVILHTSCTHYALHTLTNLANKEGGRWLRLCRLNYLNSNIY